ncbi:hypothetical protein [Methylobacterium sp. CM6244]
MWSATRAGRDTIRVEIKNGVAQVLVYVAALIPNDNQTAPLTEPERNDAWRKAKEALRASLGQMG